MVLLVHKLTHFLKNHSKLENHHHRDAADDYEAAVGEFRSGVSSFLNRIVVNSEPPEETEFWTLGKIQSLLEVLCLVHKAFVKTVAVLEHPVSVWGHEIAEEYLNYTYELLGLLNCVSSCLSHLNQARLSLSHCLNQLAVGNLPSSSAAKHLREIKIQPPDLKNLKIEEVKQGNEESSVLKIAGEKQGNGEISNYKERAIHQILQILKGVSFLILGAILSGLCSDSRPYTELRKSVLEFGHEHLLISLDSVLSKEIAVKEVKEVNEAVAAAWGGDGGCAAMEMGKQLQSFEEKLEGMRKVTDNLFTEILAARSRLVDGLRCTSSGN